ncbi:MAG: hypothetical protein QM755_15540 [Luteolibacter sp.]
MIPALLSTARHLPAALTPEQAGEYTFYALLAVGVPTLFIVSLVRLITTKKLGWIVGLVVSVVLGIGGISAGLMAIGKSIQAKNGTPQIVTSKDNRVTARIPGHWKTMEDVNKDASLQVGSMTRGEYWIVFSEPKETVGLSLEEFADLASDHITTGLTGGERSQKTITTVDGHPAIQYEITGTLQKIPLSYLHTSVETPEGLHQLMMWTIQSKKAIAFPIFKDVLESIKIEDPRPPETP